MEINLDELEAKCRAATPGPWEVRAGVLRKIGEQPQIATIYRPYNSQFIAATNPAVTLELIAQLRAAREILPVLKGLVADIQGLMSESHGVAGLHRNGDIAPWGELEPGGRFERLVSLQAAIEIINKAEA